MKSIKEIQIQLNALGYGPLILDGKEGPKTTAAIKAFQIKNGLIADGVYGPKTEVKLFQQFVSRPPLSNIPVVVAATEVRDKASIARINALHPKIRNEVRVAIIKAEAGFPLNIAIRVVQGLRTIAEQNALYCQPWDKKDNDGDGKIDESDEKVTNAKGGQSYHNYGLAIDFAILYDKDGNGVYETLSWDLIKDMDRDGQADWMEVVKVFESMPGWGWGGRWTSIKDNPHFEKTFGFKVSQLLAKVNAKKVDAQGYVLI